MRNWLNNKIVTKTIDEQEVKFRRIPVGTLQKFRFLAGDVSKALAMLFKDTSHDVKVEQLSTPSSMTDESGTPFMSNEVVHEAAHPSTISLRKTQMEEGIKGIINTLFAEESFDVLAEVIIQSAWEECEGATTEDIKTKMPPNIAVQFLQGAFEASAGDYAELGKSWFQKNPKLKEILDQTTGK
jgi:hypothetical protein